MGTFPRDVLLRHRWSEGLDLTGLRVEYVSRGAPGDVAVVNGSDITLVGRDHFEVGDTVVPYHRVLRISRDGEVLFERAGRTGA